MARDGAGEQSPGLPDVFTLQRTTPAMTSPIQWAMRAASAASLVGLLVLDIAYVVALLRNEKEGKGLTEKWNRIIQYVSITAFFFFTFHALLSLLGLACS